MKTIWVTLAFISLGLVSCGTSVNSETVLSQKYIHKYGFTVDETEWNQRDGDGTIESFLASGVRVTKNFENGMLHGASTYTYPYSTTLEKTYLYDQGELLKEIRHDRRGVPMHGFTYEFDSRRVITHWDVNGAPMRIEEYEGELLWHATYFTPSNEIEAKVENGDGKRIKRSREGDLLLSDVISNGLLSTRTTYHKNGEVHMVSHFNDYELDGTQTIMAENGTLYMKNHWDQGVLNGTKTSYRDGEKLLETPYADGIIEGTQKRYDEEGKLLSEIAYKDNMMHGETVHHTGKSKYSEWFYLGHPINHTRFEILNSRDDLIAQLDEEEALK